MELFRILKNKKFIAAVIVLLLVNCVCFYITQQKSIEELGATPGAYSAAFGDNSHIFTDSDAVASVNENSSKFSILKSFADAEKMKAENSQEYEFYAQDEARLIKEYPQLYDEFKSSEYTYEELVALNEFYSHFAYQIEYQNAYGEHIESIIENGKDLSAKKLFADKNSFSYKSIQKSTSDFSANKNLKLMLVNDLPVSSVINYQPGDFLLIILCVFLSVCFAADREVSLLVNTCKKGRVMLKLRQLPVLAAFSVLCSFCVCATELLISMNIYCAPVDFFAAIQSSEQFSDCVLHINFLQLLLMQTAFKAAAAALISLLIWLLVSLSSSIILVSGIAGVIGAAELLLYRNISVQSNLSFFRTFNLFSLFDYESITDYNLVSIFSEPVRADIIMWVIVIAAVFILSALVILSGVRNYPVKTPSKAFAFLNRIFKKMSMLYSRLQSILYAGRFESFKIMHIGKGILVVAAFICVIGFTFNTNPLVFSSTDIFLNDYYSEYGGELNDSVYDSVERMQLEVDKVDAEFSLISERYSAGEISLDEFEEIRAKSEAYDTQRSAIEILNVQINRIAPLKDNGITLIMVNEIVYENLFYGTSNQQEILILLCAVILLFSPIFSIEKSSNMLALNHCAENGRGRLYLKKLLTVAPKALLLTALSYAALLLQNNYLYGFNNLNADIHNLQCLSGVGLNISILQYIVLNFIFEFVFVTAAAMIVTAMSAFMSQLAVIIISACAFVLPGALYMLPIYSAKDISATYLFNFNSLVLDKGMESGTFAMHFVLIFVCAIILIFCRKKWCSTRNR